MEKDENIIKEAEEEAKRIHDLEAQAPVEQPAEPVQAPTPAPEEPKKDNKLAIIILAVLLLAVAGFAVWYFVLGGNGKSSSKKEEPKQEEKKENKEIENKEVENKEVENKEETKDENKEVIEPVEQPVEEPGPEQQQIPTPPPTPTPAPTPEPPVETEPVDEIEEIPGTVLYISEDSSVGTDDMFFELVTMDPLVVDVTVKGNTKRYNVTLNQETKIEGIKNKIVFGTYKSDDGDDYIAINFK